MTANFEYSDNNTDNLELPVQMELSEKVGAFSSFFIAFLESPLNCAHFEKESGSYGSSISEVIDSQRRLYLQA